MTVIVVNLVVAWPCRFAITPPRYVKKPVIFYQTLKFLKETGLAQTLGKFLKGCWAGTLILGNKSIVTTTAKQEHLQTTHFVDDASLSWSII